MGACGHWAWFNKKTKKHERFFCNSGNCFRERCRVQFWSKRVKLLTALIREHSLIRFFTLTLDPKWQNDPSVSAWEYINTPWSKLRKRLKRRFPDFKFVAILETHKYRDVPHIHGFTNIWLDVKEWSKLWSECRGGQIVWIEQVKKGQQVSKYVNKQIEVARYVSKDTIQASNKANKKYRTLWRSINTKAKFELTNDKNWTILKEEYYDDNGEVSNFHSKKGIWAYGKEKQKRQDLEATRSALP